jgi:hypothetical protein
MKTAQRVVKTIIGGLAAGLALASPLHAQTAPMPGMPPPAAPMPGMDGMMQMHKKMQQMQADTKAMDDSLAALVVTMNQATGSDKTNAMAAVITKMAQQREMMDQKMAAMQKAMMQGMMGKGMMGGMGSGMKMPPTTNKPMTMDPSMTMPPSK